MLSENVMVSMESKNISNDQELLRSDPISEGLDGVYWLENNGHFLILIRE